MQNATDAIVQGKLTPVSEGVKEALRGGTRASPKAFALIFKVNADEKKAELHRIQAVWALITSTERKELDTVLRGVIEEDAGKYQVEDGGKMVDVAPVVFEMVKGGLALNVARARLSEIRAVRDGYRAGLEVKGIKGWHQLVAAARKASSAKKAADNKAAERRHLMELTEKAREDANLPADADLPAEKVAELMKRARELYGEEQETAQAKAYQKSVDRAVDRIVKDKPLEFAESVLSALSARVKGMKATPKAKAAPAADEATGTDDARPARGRGRKATAEAVH